MHFMILCVVSFRPHPRPSSQSVSLLSLFSPLFLLSLLLYPPSELSLFFSHSCALFGTLQNSTPFFSMGFALFAPKQPGWGCRLALSKASMLLRPPASFRLVPPYTS